MTRRALDSVVIAAHWREKGGERHVLLRSALRVPLWLRESSHAKERLTEINPTLWELPAGLVEPGESFEQAALRELFEETGARVEAGALQPLGPTMFPAPALIAEGQAFFHVEIDPRKLEPPPGDQSPLEEAGVVAALPLREALQLCALGSIRDAKTELGLRRLQEVL